MNLKPIAEYLESQGLGTGGRDLFVNYMPEDVQQGILLMNKLSGTPIDWELPGYRRSGFQLIVRHTDDEAGLLMAEQLSDALTLTNTTLTGMLVKVIRPKHEPVVYPVSKGDYLEISVNFEAIYVKP